MDYPADLPIKTLQRANRKLKKELHDLIKCNRSVLFNVDKVMTMPSTEARGRLMAKIMTHLELHTDIAWHSGLGKPLKGQKVLRPRAKRKTLLQQIAEGTE